MKWHLLGFALAIAISTAGQAVAQAQSNDARKPVLMLKPSLWVPKKVSKSELRPILKPAAAPVIDSGEAYVPPAEVNTLSATQGALPVQLASAHVSAAPATQQLAKDNQAPAAVTEFIGRYLGAGVEVALAPTASEPPRRMSEVDISGSANEFTVKWATMRVGANFKPETVKASQQQFTFRPSGTPGKYVAAATPDQASLEATAEIRGRTMIVVVTSTLPNGGKSVQRYERTLNESGMDVVFTRTEGGAVVRQVNLSLTRAGTSLWRGL